MITNSLYILAPGAAGRPFVTLRDGRDLLLTRVVAPREAQFWRLLLGAQTGA